MHGRGACVAGWGVCGQGRAWRGCVAGGMRGGGCASQAGFCGEGMYGRGGVHGIRSMSGRYASHWNALLYFTDFCSFLIFKNAFLAL